ncbi:hypothetical protein C7E17_23980, partial [Stenotrophomonas maltophilia]
VIIASAQPLALQQTLPGRAVPFEISEVRPQVGGLIRQRLFTEGQQVKAGQLLYQVDPAPYQAAFDTARGQLAQAEATVLVGGLIRQRLFTEGQQVKAGQLLYQVDPAPYQAA